MERVTGDIDGRELSIGDLDPSGILFLVQFSADLEAGISGGRRDQLGDCAIAAQRLVVDLWQF